MSKRSWRIEVLGDLRVFRDGQQVEIPGSVVRRILAVLALAGPQGLSAAALLERLGRGSARNVRQQLHTNISSLRRRGLPMPAADADGVYRLGTSDEEVAVDAWDFVAGVAALELSEGPHLGEVGRLLAMWRADPFTAWDIREQDTALGKARIDLIEAVRVIDRRRVIPELVAFVDCFPGDDRLRRLLKRQAPQGKLLLVEDQVLADLTEILSAEGYDVLPVGSYAQWLKVKDSREFEEVTGALIDRHLNAELTPRDEGLAVAEYLRDNSNVRPSLLTVDTDPSSAVNENLEVTFRLLDIVRKVAKDGGGLDEGPVRKAAKDVMRPDAAVQKRWLKRCLENAKLQADTSSGTGPIGRSRRDRLIGQIRAIETQMEAGELEEAAEAYRRYINQRS